MENPFSADNTNPFLTPYQAPANSAAAPGIKPFTAVDLAPPPVPSGPYSDGGFNNAFLGRNDPINLMQPAQAPTPSVDSGLAQARGLSPSSSAAHAAQVANPFTSKPSPAAAAPADFTPVPERPMAAAAPAADPMERPAVPKPATLPRKPALSMTDAPEPSHPSARDGFLVTTSQSVDGRTIAKYLGVVSVEIVIPKDILFRNPAPYGEMHRIKSAEEQLQSVKKKAFEELTDRAKQLGADGIVGATLQFSQFDAVVFLCSAVGSAVQFR